MSRRFFGVFLELAVRPQVNDISNARGAVIIVVVIEVLAVLGANIVLERLRDGGALFWREVKLEQAHVAIELLVKPQHRFIRDHADPELQPPHDVLWHDGGVEAEHPVVVGSPDAKPRILDGDGGVPEPGGDVIARAERHEDDLEILWVARPIAPRCRGRDALRRSIRREHADNREHHQRASEPARHPLEPSTLVHQNVYPTLKCK